jgi:hypothetical protein
MASSENAHSDYIPDHLLQPLLRYMESHKTQRLDLSISATDAVSSEGESTHTSVALLEVEHNCIEDNEAPEAPGLTGAFIVVDPGF